jgi:hypothetical protein
MSTRALYTFKGENAADTWNVYKHHDGYPTGAANVLQNTLKYFAWVLPRYEADEFAAAFCAAGKADYYLRAVEAVEAHDAKEYKFALRYTALGETKNQGGGVRMMPQGPALKVAAKNCSDIEYRYEIYQKANVLRVRAYAVNAWDDKPTETLLTDCPLAEFAAWAEAAERAEQS